MAVDPYWLKVVLLLTMDGVNGSNVFPDSSVNNFPMTPVTSGGGPVIDTSAPMFGTGAMNLGSVFGTRGVTTPITAGGPLDMGAGDFTVEGWFKYNITPSYSSEIMGAYTLGNGSSYGGFNVGANSGTGAIGFQLVIGGTQYGNGSPNPAIVAGVWHHFACVRHGTTTVCYLDGVGGAPLTVPAGAITSDTTLGVGLVPPVGNSFPGELDEVRITKGIARYTANFTPQGPFPTGLGLGDIPDPNTWTDPEGNIPPLAFQNVPQNVPYPLNGDGRYWFAASAFAPTSDPITFIGDPAFYIDTMALQWSITQAATDGSSLYLAYTTDGISFTAVPIGPSIQGHSLLNGQVLAALAGTTVLSVKVYSSGGISSSTALPWNVAVAITRNANETIAWDSPNPFDPINYNCECTDDVVPTATLAALRTRILARLGFIVPPPVNATATFLQLQTRVIARCGFKTLLAQVSGQTLLQMQTYLMNRTGFAAMAANPPPGMPAMMTAIINEAQQGLWRRYAEDGYADAAPALLVNPTDVLTLDNLAVQLSSVATMKAHYGQQDAQVMGNQFENYLKELMLRTPPNLTTVVSQCINDAMQTVWRRYGYEVNGIITAAAPVPLVLTTDVCTLDSQAVETLSVALVKAHYGQKDAQAIAAQVETYITELLKRQPPNITAILNDYLIDGQQYLYRRYSQLHTRRMFRWKVNPGQRFYSLKDNDEDVLCDYQMDPLKQIEWAGIQDSRNVWYPLIEGIPPQLYTMITKPWRPARYEIRQCIEIYPMPDQTYWLWMKAHFGLMAFAADSDSTTIDCNLLFLHALANAKAHYGQADAVNVAKQASDYRKELIAGTHGTKKYVPGTIAVPPAVRPTLLQFNDRPGG